MTLVKAAARNLGFDFAAIAPCEPPPHADALDPWLARGRAGEMHWLARSPDRRKDPRLVHPEARSVIVLGLGYFQRALPPDVLADPSRGRFAMYAWGRDYHDLMLPRLKSLGKTLSYLAEREVSFRAYVDTGPLLERPLGEAAQAGFIGKNTLLIQRGLGSYFFLGELLVDLDLTPDPPPPVRFRCGTCVRCGDACPTGALDTAYTVNAPRCISYLTIEHRGPIPRDLRPKLGNRVYGCDVCQDVCPYNARNIPVTGEEHFRPTDPEVSAPKLTDLMSMDDEVFRERFRGSAVKRTRRRGLLRNVAVALGNWGSDEAVPHLERALEDVEPLVRGHSAWALGRIGGVRAGRALESARIRETDSYVLDEIRDALDERG